MSNSKASEETIVLDRVEASSAKRVKGMPYVLGLSTVGAVVVLVMVVVMFV